MVDSPDEWLWSNWHHMVGRVPSPDWLTSEMILSYFSSHRDQAIASYITFVGDGVDVKIWDDLQQQIYLGDDEFIQKHQLMTELLMGDITEIPIEQRKIKQLTLKEYQSKYPDKNQAIYYAYLSGQYTQKQIGEHFNLHYSRVSQIISKVKD